MSLSFEICKPRENLHTAHPLIHRSYLHSKSVLCGVQTFTILSRLK